MKSKLIVMALSLTMIACNDTDRAECYEWNTKKSCLGSVAKHYNVRLINGSETVALAIHTIKEQYYFVSESGLVVPIQWKGIK